MQRRSGDSSTRLGGWGLGVGVGVEVRKQKPRISIIHSDIPGKTNNTRSYTVGRVKHHKVFSSVPHGLTSFLVDLAAAPRCLFLSTDSGMNGVRSWQTQQQLYVEKCHTLFTHV